MNGRIYAPVGACVALCISNYSLAQSTPNAESSDTLEEVVVTAEKRSEDIQTTPLAITALSGEQLAERNIKSIADLQYNTPGLSVSNTGIIPLVNIRGVGLALVSPNTSSGIINYRDGVLITHEPFLVDAYYDQARIEVLRGPQGTLAGSNSTGGALLVVSRDPTLDGEHNGYISQEVGNYSDLKTEGAVTLPIDSSWAARIAFNNETRNSYYDDFGAPGGTSVSSSNVPGALSQQGVRVSLLGQPLDTLKVLLKSEYNNNHGAGIPNSPTPFSPYYAYAAHAPYTLDYDETDTLTSNVDWRSILTLDWQFATGAELRSQTAWFQGTNRETDDGDASAFTGQKTSFDVQFRTLQQEFDLLSTGQGPWQWTLGSFFYNDKVDNKQFLITNFGTPTGPAGPFHIAPYGKQKAMDYAFFGQTTYDITQQWEVLFGARFTQNRRWSPNGGVAITPAPGIPSFNLPPSAIYDKGVGTGKVGVNWKYASDSLVYAFVARGAKSGGYNTPGPALFNPETVTDYEVGWKATAFDGHLKTQLDAFYMDYKNFQLNQYNPVTQASSVANVGSAKIKGPEGQLQALFGGLGIDGTFAYVDSSLGSQVLYDTRYAPAIPFNVSGHVAPYAPKWTANIGAQYSLAVGGGTLTPRVQFSYVSSQYSQVFQVANGAYNPARDYMDSRNLIDATLTWVPSKEWLVELYGKNLANRLYVQAINSSSTTDNNIYGSPRTFGARAMYQF